MSRYQSIENELKAINGAVFQELCDKFLTRKNKNYTAFSRTGSQTGKQKTIKGTPDSFFLLANGNYIYVETTTDSSTKEKLANDIKACFLPEKTKIPIEKIEEITLCFNFNIDQKEIDKLDNLARSYQKNIRMSYWSLDSLAIELHMHYRDLVHEYLKLPLDTGQIVSIENFVEEYNRASKGIATPLSNKFSHREKEKEEVKNTLLDFDFIILTGSPGVGKTRLAIETIKEFLNENSTYSAYCISYKNHSLLNDLYQYFDKDRDYVLFVDDANRMDAFGQITGFYNSTRTGKLKIIITVRDYAFQEIELSCLDYNPKSIDIQKLNRDQITDIIKNHPFEILNSRYQRKIINIADGNPRLAIMASLLVLEKQSLDVLSDVSELFERYFSTFIRDQGEFANILNIKCLGVIAFFHTLPYKNRELTSSILKNFGIDYHHFADAIDKLDRLELVETQYEYVKIPEQNLSTYFFYKSFIKENYLSFQVLLEKYFDNNKNRFTDCVIPANNTFGHENVMRKLQSNLQEHWEIIRDDKDKAHSFLSTFWFYLQLETLEFFHNEISLLPTVEVAKYEVTYKVNAFSYTQNKTIKLLGEFLRHPSRHLKDSIELLFEYARKCPEHLPELIYKIREELIFDQDDEKTGFFRQKTLFDFLIERFKSKDHLCKSVFFALAETFLSFEFRHTKSERDYSMHFYNYPIPNTKPIRELRESIWKMVESSFSQNSTKPLELMISYSENHRAIKEIMEFDISFIIRIIDNYLSVNSFEHCRYVQKQIKSWTRNEISSPIFSRYKRSFVNPTYEMFLKLDWDKFRDKESYEFDSSQEYERLKEAEIRSTFLFTNQKDVQFFYDKFIFLKKESENDYGYCQTIDHVLDANCINNFDLGFQLLSLVVDKKNEIHYRPKLVFQSQLKTQEKANKIWELIEKGSFQGKVHWELSFYENIDESLIDNNHQRAIAKSIANIENSTFMHIDRFDKFLKIDPKFFHNFLKIIVEKYKKDGVELRIEENFFKQHFDRLEDDIELLKQAYLQQILVRQHFDSEGIYFARILRKAPSFLMDFVRALYSKDNDDPDGSLKNLSFVWKIEKIEKELALVIDFIVQHNFYVGASEHFCNNFFFKFEDLKDKEKKRADKFLMDYLTANHEDYQKVNIVIDIVRNSRKELFRNALLHYVSLNQNKESFSKIWWRGNGGSYVGDNIIGDLQAAEWRNILSIVEESNLGIKLLPIKKYINDEIEWCLKRGEEEKRRKFLQR